MTVNVKLTQLDEQTTVPVGSFLYMVIPIGGGNYVSKKIDPTYLQQPADVITDKLVLQGAAFTKAFDASAYVAGVYFNWVSGTPAIKVGLTVGGSEISGLPTGTPVSPTTKSLTVSVDSTYVDATTLYIDITGGAVNVNFRYINNFF